ncbi:MAG: DUF1836 domain-containing protein [Lentilactobacillus diolivorans]|jgi:hypothetical protein|uniref:BS ykrK family protein n=2 Tax=Lentilactobacillus diolivorans TaxID=179838 RepID=A0A0R1S8P5_9LACO|nr:DUF1836 domain-containing protein [Lentilactobacillus diolivorans]KRL65212.1 hypothetical protein FC85_GL000354 [Lentilactobacillus diolivorans DSM 14421]MDH5107100.1 DUF1836 domain-containing protein [Lentilactobacillus diolivorans]RRG02640.1 MAG: DUF1836 domain-containing protein [Lactobacillus sp.]GEP24642.1 hypothetical protein LDI01_22350 [Lentilactobacillus diolivorans]
MAVEKSEEKLQQKLSKISLPKYQDLPNLDLYMDQVIDEINQYLIPITKTAITKSMINSYVKKGIVDRPTKKRYSRVQLAKLLVVSILKPILSLDAITQALRIAMKLDSVDNAYDQFVTLFNTELKQIDIPNLSAKQYQSMAIKSLLYKLLVEDLITRNI